MSYRKINQSFWEGDLAAFLRSDPESQALALYLITCPHANAIGCYRLSKATMFGPAEVAERYHVPEDRAGAAYAELALLRGDPSDGLPGVPGVGEKTAAAMLARYGTLAAILAAANDPESSLPKAFRGRILSATDYIAAAGPVVRVARDAPVRLSGTDDRLPVVPADPGRVDQLGQDYGISSSITRLQKAIEAASA